MIIAKMGEEEDSVQAHIVDWDEALKDSAAYRSECGKWVTDDRWMVRWELFPSGITISPDQTPDASRVLGHLPPVEQRVELRETRWVLHPGAQLWVGDDGSYRFVDERFLDLLNLGESVVSRRGSAVLEDRDKGACLFVLAAGKPEAVVAPLYCHHDKEIAAVAAAIAALKRGEAQ